MKPVKVAIYIQDYYSVDTEKQLNKSEETLIEYINAEPAWEYIDTFVDIDRNFPSYHLDRLVREANKEAIDIVLVSSLSKFNESLSYAMDTIGDLLSMGIRVIFFDEGIDSNTDKGKMLLEKLGSTLAIEKKLSSVNRKWTFDKMFEKGNVVFARLLGYKKADAEWVIIPEEAEIVREAFKLHLEGLSLLQIARRFISKKYSKASGRMDWTPTAIKNIIKNERYTGDVLCRKTQSDEDVATGLTIRKEQYLIKDHHEGIISRDDFEKANKLLWQGVKGEDRGDIPQYPLSRKLKCDLCGANFQRYYSKGKVFWRCGTHTKSKSLCPMTGINEDVINKALRKAFFDKFIEVVKDFGILIDFLKKAERFKEEFLNPLTERIDQIIKEENDAVFLNDFNKTEELKREKGEMESLLLDHSKTLEMIENDFSVRMKATVILNELICNEGKISDLREALNDLWVIRAFMVRVTVRSVGLYVIEWLNNEYSVVEMEVGE